jgi:hypothetical protein
VYDKASSLHLRFLTSRPFIEGSEKKLREYFSFIEAFRKTGALIKIGNRVDKAPSAS